MDGHPWSLDGLYMDGINYILLHICLSGGIGWKLHVLGMGCNTTIKHRLVKNNYYHSFFYPRVAKKRGEFK